MIAKIILKLSRGKVEGNKKIESQCSFLFWSAVSVILHYYLNNNISLNLKKKGTFPNRSLRTRSKHPLISVGAHRVLWNILCPFS